MKISVHEKETPIQVNSIESLNNVIAKAEAEAQIQRKINVIFFTADNGNEISMAVGNVETVLGFIYSHQNPPYLASQGKSESEEPVMTCYIALEYHTEYPRNWVIPLSEGIMAVHEFFATGELPKSISWVVV